MVFKSHFNKAGIIKNKQTNKTCSLSKLSKFQIENATQLLLYHKNVEITFPSKCWQISDVGSRQNIHISDAKAMIPPSQIPPSQPTPSCSLNGPALHGHSAHSAIRSEKPQVEFILFQKTKFSGFRNSIFFTSNNDLIRLWKAGFPMASHSKIKNKPEGRRKCHHNGEKINQLD